MYQYRSIQDLNQSLQRGLHRFPKDLDVVVGIPRSGLLAANLLSLKLNLPLTDLEGLCEGRITAGGVRAPGLFSEDIKKALIIDDSIFTGSALANAKSRIEKFCRKDLSICFCAVYVLPGTESMVDLPIESCESPRVFEWNIMHHFALENACMDIDGVLCRDPTDAENDDGEAYVRFLRTVEPAQHPSKTISTLVTCRLEKYRQHTQTWLSEHSIRYGELVMLDLPNGLARRQWGRHGEFKGEIYRKSTCELFIESDVNQACIIADIACRPVLAWDIQQIVPPRAHAVYRRAAEKIPDVLKRRMQFVSSRFGRWLAERVRY